MTAVDHEETTGSAPTGTTANRLRHAIGPIAGGLLLDAADLFTFGPIGIYAGFVVGATAAFLLTTLFRLPVGMRLFWAVLGGLYCTMPMTEFLPLAAIGGAVQRFFDWSAK